MTSMVAWCGGTWYLPVAVQQRAATCQDPRQFRDWQGQREVLQVLRNQNQYSQGFQSLALAPFVARFDDGAGLILILWVWDVWGSG